MCAAGCVGTLRRRRNSRCEAHSVVYTHRPVLSPKNATALGDKAHGGLVHEGRSPEKRQRRVPMDKKLKLFRLPLKIEFTSRSMRMADCQDIVIDGTTVGEEIHCVVDVPRPWRNCERSCIVQPLVASLRMQGGGQALTHRLATGLIQERKSYQPIAS